MNKQNQPNTAGNDPAETGTTAQTITEIMTQPGFAAEQLPELWQTTGGRCDLHDEWANAWNDGVDTMFRRCETYPEHAKIRAVLSGMPDGAWYYRTHISDHGDDMLKQADTEQLLQALAHEQQHTDDWPTTHQILLWGTIEQLTGPVIEQLRWCNALNHYATGPPRPLLPERESAYRQRIRRIVEHTQQLFENNKNAWATFLGIAEPNLTIGDTARLALAIEHQHRPDRNQT